MSKFDYVESREIATTDPSFSALIMAAYRKADTINSALLEASWPDIVTELQERYNTPGGLVASEGGVRD